VSDISVKSVPSEQIALLRERAKRNHRSLQGELRAIIDDIAAQEKAAQQMTLRELSTYIQSLGVKTGNEATTMIRDDRDSR